MPKNQHLRNKILISPNNNNYALKTVLISNAQN